MSEKFLSREEKRSASDTELIREGADLIYDGKNDKPRIKVTDKQIEEARNEMEEYFAIAKKEKEEKLKAAIEIEKTLQDFLMAVQDGDSKKVDKNVIDLITKVAEIEDRQEGIFSKTVRGKRSFDGMLQRLSKWLSGEEIPLDWGNAPVNTPFSIEHVISDRDNRYALAVRSILKKMGDPRSCLQVQRRDGKIACPNCEKRQSSY